MEGDAKQSAPREVELLAGGQEKPSYRKGCLDKGYCPLKPGGNVSHGKASEKSLGLWLNHPPLVLGTGDSDKGIYRTINSTRGY